MAYEIEFADTAINHLAALTARDRSVAIDAIETQLSYEPLVETRNRKLLRPNPIASWELRVGALRVFYDVASNRRNRRCFAPGPHSGGRQETPERVADRWKGS